MANIYLVVCFPTIYVTEQAEEEGEEFNVVHILADACECGNEPSGSVKCGEFLD